MTAGRTWWVTVAGRNEPLEVAVTPEGDGWSIVVALEDGPRTFRVSEGPGPDRAWVDGRPTTYAWEPSQEGPGRLALDGLVHAVEVAGEAKHRLVEMGIGAAGAHRAREIRAPMPGLVLAIEVEEGTEVAAGAGILIIEAMKMENEITAPIAGVVAELAVESGQAIEQGTLLCRIEPPEEPS